LVTAVSDWLSAGGLFITAGCLASVATLVLVLSVAACLVRTRCRRKTPTTTTTTKIELQDASTSDPLAAPAHDPLLATAADIGQLSDVVALNEFEAEPVRYVVGRPPKPTYYYATSQYYTDAAYCCRSKAWSVSLSVGRSVTAVSPAKMAEFLPHAVGGVVQRLSIGLWPMCFRCPALDL